MFRDNIGDTSMTSMATTAVDVEYLDGIETHKIPDHSMFLRTFGQPEMRPILIVEVKRLSFRVANRPMTINDLSFNIFDVHVLAYATGLAKNAVNQVLKQLECVFDQYNANSVPFLDALIIVGPYYQRITARRPTVSQPNIKLEYCGGTKRFFSDNLSDISASFNEDWKEICQSHGLSN